MVIPLGDYGSAKERRLARFTRFVKRHASLFEDIARNARVAVLHVKNPETRTQQWAFLGAAQALSDSSIPHDVIHLKNDRHREDTLAIEDLRPYSVIVFPFRHALSEAQRAALTDYARSGKAVVLLDTDHDFPVPHETGAHKIDRGALVVTRNEDSAIHNLGEAYYREYADPQRSALVRIVCSRLSSGAPVDLAGTGRRTTALVYAQPASNKTVVHLLNYDYDPDGDEFLPIDNVTVSVSAPCYGLAAGEEYSCVALSPERDEPLSLPCRWSGDDLKVTLARLGMYEMLVIEP